MTDQYSPKRRPPSGVTTNVVIPSASPPPAYRPGSSMTRPKTTQEVLVSGPVAALETSASVALGNLMMEGMARLNEHRQELIAAHPDLDMMIAPIMVNTLHLMLNIQSRAASQETGK